MFPDASVAVQVTVVLPKGKATGALLVTEATEQLSAVVGVPSVVTVALQVPMAGLGLLVVWSPIALWIVQRMAMVLPAAALGEAVGKASGDKISIATFVVIFSFLPNAS